MLKRTKSCLILAVVMLAAGAVHAERGDDTDRKSKNGLAEGVVDGVNVVVEYGRPNANDRTIWGGLVPYGAVWRTGANEATTISFDKDVTVEGVAVPAGTYALFTLPAEDECTIILNSVAEQWGAFDYDSSKDVASVKVTPQATEHVETFEISIVPGGVQLSWADRTMTFAVAAAS